ncbi:MAG: bifunctional glutamine amidotransferase/anthranilate phosphoribosyltransferase, partial [Dehalococcoidia bacterium]
QVLGVAEEALLEKMALVLRSLGCHHALVVHGEDGLDEVTLTGKTQVCELKDNNIKKYTISPEDSGLPRASLDNLKGGTAGENASRLRSVLAGVLGPQRDVVLMNASAALIAGNKVETFQQGVTLAGEVIDSGQALAKVEQLIQFSQSLI